MIGGDFNASKNKVLKSNNIGTTLISVDLLYCINAV